MENRLEFRVGIVVSLALLILVIGIIWGKGLSVLSGRSHYSARFESVQGLEEGDPVMIRGTTQGRIKSIRLLPEAVHVDFWIHSGITLFSDARCAVESEELMGGKQLTVDPGSKEPQLEEGTLLAGFVRGDIGRFLGSVEGTVATADSVLRGIMKVFGDSAWIRMTADAERAVSVVHAILAENSRDLRHIVTRLDSLTVGLSSASIPERWASAMDAVDRLSAGLDSTVQLTNRALGRLEREEGTLGKLIRDRHLFDQLLSTSAELDSLLTDIKANPKRYVHFSLF